MKTLGIFCALALFILDTASSSEDGKCMSPIYCSPSLLDIIQLSGIFDDDKTFVDKPTIKSEKDVLRSFRALGSNPTNKQLTEFLNNNFGDKSTVVKSTVVTGFTDSPKFLDTIKSPYLKGFGKAVHQVWRNLTKTFDRSGLCSGCVSSFLDIEGPFVIPGGRFFELYYWDSYFIIEGLLKSELPDLSKNMIKAFVSLINRYGYVPNGTREYYLNRSQPPMLAQMVDIYISATGDTKILIDVLPALKKEYNHWASTHMIKVKRQTGDDVTEHNVFRYKAKSNIARPESYRTDLQTANLFSNDTSKRTALFCEIVAATESGHDFSSRWIKGYVGPNSNPIHLLTQLNTSDVVPPELNAILYRNMQLIYKLSGIAINATNNKNLRRRYLDDQHLFKAKAEKLKSSIFDLLFDADSGMFNDWSISGNNFTGVWSPANLWPYWYLSDDINPGSISNAWESVSDIASTNPGGIPATLVNTGLQWDYPDVWAPHQYVLIKAILSSVKSISSSTNNTAAVPTTKHELSRNGTFDSEASMYYNLLSQHSELKALALQIAQSFINNAYCGWYFTGGSIPDLLEKLPNVRGDGQMFEKYDAKIIGKQAEGGEYAGQYGFGWTNGVILWLLDLFGKDLVNPTCTKHP